MSAAEIYDCLLDKMSSQMLYRYILILSEGIPKDEAANYVG